MYSFKAIYNIICRSKLFSSRVKYITEDAASVCTWYLKFHTHMDEARNASRWPDAIYLHMGRLFSIQIFDHSAAFDCRDILEAEKGMPEVYQKRTFIEIDTNLRKFSAIFSNVVFKEYAYYWENEKKFFLHITLNRCWNLKDFKDQVSNKSAPHNFHSKR